MKKIASLILLIALVVVSGCPDNETPIGGDTDEHGCLTAAGYSWCESKEKCLRIWEEECPITESVCKDAGGNWNECSNKCQLDNQGKEGVACTMMCEQLCECAGFAGFNCPAGYTCKFPDGIPDALGYCVQDIGEEKAQTRALAYAKSMDEYTTENGRNLEVEGITMIDGTTWQVSLTYDVDSAKGQDHDQIKVLITITNNEIVDVVSSRGSVSDITVFTEEESRQIAEQYILDSPTYKFDGSGLKYEETTVMRCPSCYRFTYRFTSSHAGYGDRTGQILAQMITTHTAEITVIEGKVTTAALDKKWDMITQSEIFTTCATTDKSVEMTIKEAIEIAENSECTQDGTLAETYTCNDYTGTWWLDLNIDKPGCNPACVINIETKEAEINWRCTGLITPPESEDETINAMSGYTSYTIAETTDTECETDDDCQTPFDYLVRSNCPYTSKCIENKCNVICPEY